MRTRSNNEFDYRALAEFRYGIRRLLNLSEQAARAAGIEPQQYQALLAIKGLPGARKATVGVLAERLQIQHHSAVELADRMEAHGLIKRNRSQADRREVFLCLTHRGEELVKEIALPHRAELRSVGHALLRTLEAVMAAAGRGANSRSRAVRHKSSNRIAKKRQ